MRDIMWTLQMFAILKQRIEYLTVKNDECYLIIFNDVSLSDMKAQNNENVYFHFRHTTTHDRVDAIGRCTAAHWKRKALRE